MGEMLVANMKGNIPLIITRPTLIVSTHSEPFPGWIEDLSTLDFVVVEYGKQTITDFVGHPDTIIDVIPADIVISCMMIALVAYSKNISKNLIYHIGSSFRNPFKTSDLQDTMYSYFTNNPWVNTNGKPVPVTKKLTLHSTSMDYLQFPQNKGSRMESVAELYRPYALFEGIFDDQNTEKLRMAAKRVELDEGFNFDPKNINWKDYMMNTHFPGLIKYHSIRSKM